MKRPAGSSSGKPTERRRPAADRVAAGRASWRAGDSLAVNGVCLTVIAADAGEIHADVGPETLRVTTLGALPAGRRR